MSNPNPNTRIRIFEEAKYICQVCGLKMIGFNPITKQWFGLKPIQYKKHVGYKKLILTLDHLVPIAKNGLNAKINYIAMYKECNNNKKDKNPLEWLNEITLYDEDKRSWLYNKIMNSISFHKSKNINQ